MFTQGYTTDAHGLLNRARYVIGTQTQYDDGVWTYPWVWAIYLLKTGDLSFVKANFDTEGSTGKTEPSIEDTAHLIAADRTGPGGIMEETNDIDANGYWTIDNYEALMGLWAYHWLAQQVGNTTEANWAAAQYASLLAATNKTLNATISANHLNYLPCSMIEPNTSNRCSNAEDANWAAPFLFGRWAWDGYLFGAPTSGPGISLIDATYQYGFARLAGKLPANTFGGYPTQYYSTAYNAGYGEWGLASSDYRDQGILSYKFMVGRRAERALLLVGKPAVPEPRLTVGRGASGGRQRLVAARLGHGQREHGAARLAGRAAVRRQSRRGPRRARFLGGQRPGHQPGELPHHRRPAHRPDHPHQRRGGHADASW